MIETYEADLSPAHASDAVADVLGIVPFAGDIVGGLVRTAWKAAEPGENDYSEAVRVYRVDGVSVAVTLKEIEVPAGVRRVDVRYCRYEEFRSVCSDLMELQFIAKVGKRYRLRRNTEFHIELLTGDKTVAVSEEKAGVAQDEERCLFHRRNSIERRKENSEVSAAEASRLDAQAAAKCESLVWGDGNRPN